MVSKVLFKKLYRDLLQMKMQVFSISLVVAIGVAVLIGFSATYDSLNLAQSSFYSHAHFPDLFINLKRAPTYALDEVKSNPAILEIESRLEYSGLLSIPGFSESGTAHLISIPDGKQPKLSLLHLKSGQLPSAHSTHEAVISEGLFNYHNLRLGSIVSVTMNGKITSLKIVGVGQSPEHIITLTEGTPFPDDAHNALLWVNQSLLENTFDMKGAFNYLVLKVSPLVSQEKIISDLETILGKYGTLSINSRNHQLSHVYVEQELKELQVFATALPIIFFLVSAFVLNIVMTRLIQTQRSEIATMKALGISNYTIVGYYFYLSGLIIVFGNLIGTTLGYWIGDYMTRLYTQFFHFPILMFELSYTRLSIAYFSTFLITTLGLFNALIKIFNLSPAEAMRPPEPAIFKVFGLEKNHWFQTVDTKSKMALRGLLNRPLKSALSTLALSFTIVLLVCGLFWSDSLDYLIYAQFGLAQRETGQIVLTKNLPTSAEYELKNTPGILEAEGMRILPIEITFQTESKRTSLRALPENAQLQTLIDENLNNIPIPMGGIYLSKILAEQIGATIGDKVEIRFLEGRKEKIQLKIDKIIDSFMSNEVITSRKSLSFILKEDDLINVLAFRSIADQSRIHSIIKEKPNVLSVNFKDSSYKTFMNTSAKFLLVFAAILSVFAGAIGFGVSFNNLQISLSERDWELASLRILGFRSFETFKILGSEVFSLLILSIPIGWIGGVFLAKWLLSVMDMESLNIPFIMNPTTFLFAAIILILSSMMSATLIFFRLKKMDLIATLKTRG